MLGRCLRRHPHSVTWVVWGFNGAIIGTDGKPRGGRSVDMGAWKAARVAWSEAGTTPIYARITAFHDQVFLRYS